MATPRERATFLKVSEIVERTRRYAERAQDLLIQGMRERKTDERTRIFLDMVEQQRAELEAAMDRAIARAPDRILETGAQYSVDPWEAEPEPPCCDSIEEATRWIVELDERLLQTYVELAERSESEAVREFFESLAGMVRGFDRRLSRESENAYDV